MQRGSHTTLISQVSLQLKGLLGALARQFVVLLPVRDATEHGQQPGLELLVWQLSCKVQTLLKQGLRLSEPLLEGDGAAEVIKDLSHQLLVRQGLRQGEAF